MADPPHDDARPRSSPALTLCDVPAAQVAKECIPLFLISLRYVEEETEKLPAELRGIVAEKMSQLRPDLNRLAAIADAYASTDTVTGLALELADILRRTASRVRRNFRKLVPELEDARGLNRGDLALYLLDVPALMIDEADDLLDGYAQLVDRVKLVAQREGSDSTGHSQVEFDDFCSDLWRRKYRHRPDWVAEILAHLELDLSPEQKAKHAEDLRRCRLPDTAADGGERLSARRQGSVDE